MPSFGSINMYIHLCMDMNIQICMNIRNSSMKMKRGREKKDDLMQNESWVCFVYRFGIISSLYEYRNSLCGFKRIKEN